MEDNRITFRVRSPKHKEVLSEAARKHHSGSFSEYMRNWVFILVTLAKNDINPELLITNIEKFVAFCKKLKG